MYILLLLSPYNVQSFNHVKFIILIHPPPSTFKFMEPATPGYLTHRHGDSTATVAVSHS